MTCAGAVLIASLAISSAASAEVITVSPDNGGSDHLAAAVAQLASSSDANNVIILQPGEYTPNPADMPAGGIPRNVVITGYHNQQATGSVPSTYVNLSGASCGTIFKVPSGVQLALEAVQIENAPTTNPCSSGTSKPVIDVSGTLVTYGVTMYNNGESPIKVESGATADVNESTIDGNFQQSAWGIVVSQGTLNLTDSDVTDNYAGGLNILGSGTIDAVRSIIEHNGLGPSYLDCQGPTSGMVTNYLADDPEADAECDTTYGVSVTTWPTMTTNGGPVDTLAFDPAYMPSFWSVSGCPSVDGRFFVNPGANGVGGGAGTSCNIGAYSASAAQEQPSQAPKCSITYLNTSTPADEQAAATETVTATDTASGFGPQDNASVNAGSPIDDPADAITNINITNGSVSVPYAPLLPFNATSPFPGGNPGSTASIPVTAVRTALPVSYWYFTATDWAGLSTLCS